MKFLIFIVAVLLSAAAAQDVNLKQVRCLVCRNIVDEFKDAVNKIDPAKIIEIGQYRLDSKGNSFQKKLPLSTSETHLSDMLDTICKTMEDYVRATYKSNGKLTLVKLMTESGHLNPLISEVNIIQDGDLNKSLEYICSDIVNEYEDTFIDIVINKEDKPKTKICTEITKYCEGFKNLIDGDEEETEDVQEDQSKEDVKDETKDVQEDDSKEDFKDETKDVQEDTSKEDFKDETKDVQKDESKEDFKDEL